MSSESVAALKHIDTQSQSAQAAEGAHRGATSRPNPSSDPQSKKSGKRRRRMSDDMSIADDGTPPPLNRRVRFRSPSPVIEASTVQVAPHERNFQDAPPTLSDVPRSVLVVKKRQRSIDDAMSDISATTARIDQPEAIPADGAAPDELNTDSNAAGLRKPHRGASPANKRAHASRPSPDPSRLLRNLDHPTLLRILSSILTRHPQLIYTELPRFLPAGPTMHASLLRIHQLRDRALAAFPYSSIGQSRDAYALSRVRAQLDELHSAIREDASWICGTLDEVSTTLGDTDVSVGERLEYVERILRCIEQVPEGRWDASAITAEESRWALWSEIIHAYANKVLKAAGVDARWRHGTVHPLQRADVWRWAEWVARWNAVSGGALQDLVRLFQNELGWVMRGLASPPSEIPPIRLNLSGGADVAA